MALGTALTFVLSFCVLFLLFIGKNKNASQTEDDRDFRIKFTRDVNNTQLLTTHVVVQHLIRVRGEFSPPRSGVWASSS